MKLGAWVRSVALFEQLGPGLVTGAADEDPSGIATYSQAGAQFGFGLLWTMVLTYPLMAAVQLFSAHIGRVTGCGLAKNLRRSCAVSLRLGSRCSHRAGAPEASYGTWPNHWDQAAAFLLPSGFAAAIAIGTSR